jgi:hypothetical protein
VKGRGELGHESSDKDVSLACSRFDWPSFRQAPTPPPALGLNPRALRHTSTPSHTTESLTRRLRPETETTSTRLLLLVPVVMQSERAELHMRVASVIHMIQGSPLYHTRKSTEAHESRQKATPPRIDLPRTGFPPHSPRHQPQVFGQQYFQT